MTFDSERSVLRIDVREFIALSRRGISDSVPVDTDEPSLSKKSEDLTLVYPCLIGTHPAEILCHTDAITDTGMHFSCQTDTSVEHPPKTLVAQVRGEAYLSALAFMESEGQNGVALHFRYIRTVTGEEKEVIEQLTLAKVRSFYQKCAEAAAVYAEPAIERVTLRLPALKKVSFPFDHVRTGQDDFMKSVYHAVKHGGKLCAQAPTGIGKTVSVLYPATRAMGEGAVDKIFYLTPKSTTAEAAKATLEAISQVGGHLCAIVLTAKEKACRRGVVCRIGKDECSLLRENKLADAALFLYKKRIPVVGIDEIREVSDTFGVCPYEVSLCYAELCDFVICDCNYLFDPVVSLRRFFDLGGNYAFLIDEAHNLPDRVSAMYSDTLTASDLLCPTACNDTALQTLCTDTAAFLQNAVETAVKDNKRTEEDGTDVGFAHGRSLSDDLLLRFSDLVLAAENALFRAFCDKGENKGERIRALRTYYYRIKHFTDILSSFDRRYEWFMMKRGGVYTFELFCMDPSGHIRDRLSKGSSAVLFSATLTPADYYTSLFGFDRTCEVLSVDSPFDPERLSVSVMDKISTRFSERERTLPAILRVITAAISGKRGHYIVFSPSFAYNDALCKLFRAKYPKLRVLQQTPTMSEKEKKAFLTAFSEEDPSYLVAFCVMGGMYSEGIDLIGDKLIGSIIVGVGMPGLSYQREAMAAYFDERFEMGKQYAYIYPGFNKVLQAAGRVIRTEEDRGILVLIDDRFADPVYRKSIPKQWHHLKFVGDAKGLKMLVDSFWAKNP